jgi:hypothetical protein
MMMLPAPIFAESWFASFLDGRGFWHGLSGAARGYFVWLLAHLAHRVFWAADIFALAAFDIFRRLRSTLPANTLIEARTVSRFFAADLACFSIFFSSRRRAFRISNLVTSDSIETFDGLV